ncbi:sensor histidine kinase [Streptomyces sp. NBC_00083]|uniref:sensor histidine kinase n=1 Tax=Streptomyces sp. NBC_00083 TaxID=2975647 RepID=UPI00224DEBB0|nr:histidine kinase [Streptomyces sp. NBC_00083]MCX5384552.1 histidine kinase [Streptomyces sp. NBC_00083]
MAGAALFLLAVAGPLWSLPHPVFQLGAIVGAVLLFAVRRHRPGAVLLGLAVLAGAAPVAAPVVAAAAYATALDVVRPRRRAWLLGGASLLMMVSAIGTGPAFGPGSAVYSAELGFLMAATAVVVPGLVGTVHGQQARLLRALRERGDAAERARRSADNEARVQERSRIAAEMHDLVGHRLSLVSLHAGGLELALDRAAPELREEAVLVRRTTRDAMRELRQTLGVLGPLGRDTGPDALTDDTGTTSDVAALVKESRDGGIDVRLTWNGPDVDTRPAPVRRAVHRVVREALTNVHRYAHSAQVTVRVEHDERAVRVIVHNSAPARPSDTTPTEGTGRGLTGLRERVDLLGGTFAAGAGPDGGFLVRATLPAEPADTVMSKALGAGAEEPPTPRNAGASLPDGDRRTVGALMALLGASALWVLMALAIALVYGQPRHETRHPQPRLGMTYEELNGVFDSPAERAAATGHEPPRPARAVGCVFPAAGRGPRPGSFGITRYCFDAAQRLISIDRFTVPSVQDAQPWESR